MVTARASGTRTATSTSTRRRGSGSRTSATAAPRSPTPSPTQLRTLAAHHVFGDHANEPALELAARVADLAPLDDAAVLFGTGGAEAVDTAAKIVRRYWALVGQPERTVIVSRRYAYHGTNAYGTSLSGIPAVRDGYGTLVGDVAEVAHDDPADLERVLDELGRPRRGVHRRADDRRGRRDPGRRGLLARGRADLPRARRPPRGGRGDLRLRPARPLVRLRALRLHPRPDDLREGHQLGLRAARRRRRRRPGARAVLARGRGALRPRRHVLGPPGRVRRGPRQPRHPRARAARRARGDARAHARAAPRAAPRADRRRGRPQRRPGGRGRARRRPARRQPRGRRGRGSRRPPPRRPDPAPPRRGPADLAAVRRHRGRARAHRRRRSRRRCRRSSGTSCRCRVAA